MRFQFEVTQFDTSNFIWELVDVGSLSCFLLDSSVIPFHVAPLKVSTEWALKVIMFSHRKIKSMYT